MLLLTVALQGPPGGEQVRLLEGAVEGDKGGLEGNPYNAPEVAAVLREALSRGVVGWLYLWRGQFNHSMSSSDESVDVQRAWNLEHM